MCSTIDPGEKGYKLSEQILFNFLPLFSTLYRGCCAALPRGDVGLSAICDCGIYCSYSLLFLQL